MSLERITSKTAKFLSRSARNIALTTAGLATLGSAYQIQAQTPQERPAVVWETRDTIPEFTVEITHRDRSVDTIPDISLPDTSTVEIPVHIGDEYRLIFPEGFIETLERRNTIVDLFYIIREDGRIVERYTMPLSGVITQSHVRTRACVAAEPLLVDGTRGQSASACYLLFVATQRPTIVTDSIPERDRDRPRYGNGRGPPPVVVVPGENFWDVFVGYFEGESVFEDYETDPTAAERGVELEVMHGGTNHLLRLLLRDIGLEYRGEGVHARQIEGELYWGDDIGLHTRLARFNLYNGSASDEVYEATNTEFSVGAQWNKGGWEDRRHGALSLDVLADMLDVGTNWIAMMGLRGGTTTGSWQINAALEGGVVFDGPEISFSDGTTEEVEKGYRFGGDLNVTYELGPGFGAYARGFFRGGNTETDNKRTSISRWGFSGGVRLGDPFSHN